MAPCRDRFITIDIKVVKAVTTYTCPYSSGVIKYEYMGKSKNDVAFMQIVDIKYKRLFFANDITLLF